MAADNHDRSSFVRLPIASGQTIRVLGPPAAEAAVALEPLVKLDAPVTVAQSFVGAVCDPAGQIVRPLEITLIVDPATVVPDRQVPAPAVIRVLQDLPNIVQQLPPIPGFDALQALSWQPVGTGPLIYCRKQQCIFAARSPTTAEPLRAMTREQVNSGGSDTPLVPPIELTSWDGPGDGDRTVTMYGAEGGTNPLGSVASLEQLLTDQGQVAALADAAGEQDPEVRVRLGDLHGCTMCDEVGRCFPKGGGYAYATDRLVALSAVEAPLIINPLGEWRLCDAARTVGGLAPSKCVTISTTGENEFESWRARRADEMEHAGPPRLLAGEKDGRELIEIARLKLALIAGVMEQLDAAWRACERPHLCWNDDTVRVAWEHPVSAPGVCWGFRPILRKVGWQPTAPFETPDGRTLSYPPAFSAKSLLSPETLDAARHFDEPREATLFVKRAKADGASAEVEVLLEELNLGWHLFCTSDAMHVTGDEWQALLAPAAERNPDDGEGLPFIGRATGNVALLKRGEQFNKLPCRWYPRFGEAVDLHALGVLLLDSILVQDERHSTALRAKLIEERANLTKLCMAALEEQRDDQAAGWIAGRCDTDEPAAMWSRRNLLHHRDDRNATDLDAFPPLLWQAIVTYALRLTTAIPGFSFCNDRGCPTPRGPDGVLLPLVELRGLIALLDDQIFGRSAPGEAVRAAVKDSPVG